MKKSSDLESMCHVTPVHQCGYLPGEKACVQFIPLSVLADKAQFSFLNRSGYRRSGDYLYRPACQQCSACTPLRTISKQFIPSRSQQRCWKKNLDLSGSCTKAGLNQERYRLYEKYINIRHNDGEMFPPSVEQFTDFLCEGSKWCSFYEFRNKDKELLAVTVVDHLQEGIAPLYTFFDPDAALTQRGLGTFCVLWLINYAKHHDISYVYLGYWIEKCRKMVYKTKFKPYELLIQGQWCLPSQSDSCDD